MAPANWMMVGTNDLPTGDGNAGGGSSGGGGGGGGGGILSSNLSPLTPLDYPSSTQPQSTAPLLIPAASIATRDTVIPMKGMKTFLIAGAMLAAALAFGQSDSMIHVKAFQGVTVGQKVTAAQRTCVSAPVPCILILDASLAAYPEGAMPTLVSNASLYDFRSGPPTLGGATAGIFTNLTMNTPFSALTNGLSPLTEFQSAQGSEYSTDGVTSGVSVPASSSVFQVNGLAAYVRNASATTAGVGLYAQGRCNAATNGARCWGANLVATDHLDNGDASSTSSTLYGIEVDWDPTNSGDAGVGELSIANASTGMTGQTLGTAFEAQANSKANLIWHDGFDTADGAALYFGNSGASCTSGTCKSQSLRFFYYNAGSESSAETFVDSNGRFNPGTIELGGDPIYNTSASHFSWKIGCQTDVTEACTFIPSTVSGGSTFTTPSLTIYYSGKVTTKNNTLDDGSGNLSAAGNVTAAGGSNVVLRCTTAGTLPIGALTITSASCGASTDTGLRVK
jgi:hypothetical protein